MLTPEAPTSERIDTPLIACGWIAPVTEQTRIGAEVTRRLSVVDELETVATTNLQRATLLRQSIFQKAFTGQSGDISKP